MAQREVKSAATVDWQAVKAAVPNLTWMEVRHSTLCALNASGHRGPCTCEPKNIAHIRRRDVVRRG